MPRPYNDAFRRADEDRKQRDRRYRRLMEEAAVVEAERVRLQQSTLRQAFETREAQRRRTA
jgi:hypothetical protein